MIFVSTIRRLISCLHEHHHLPESRVGRQMISQPHELFLSMILNDLRDINQFRIFFPPPDDNHTLQLRLKDRA